MQYLHFTLSRPWLSVVIGLSLSMLLNATVTAQQNESTNPLAGPSVIQSTKLNGSNDEHSSMVERRFDGSVLSVGSQPILVALTHLELTVDQESALRTIKLDRSMCMANAMRTNYAELLEVFASFGSGEAESHPLILLRRISQLAHIFNPYFVRGTMQDEVSTVLTSEQQTELNQMVSEYRLAQVQARQTNNHDTRSSNQIVIEIRMEEFGMLVGEMFEARASIDAENFRALIDYLELTPTQVSQIEGIYQDIGTRSLLGVDVSPSEQLAAYADLHHLLTPMQQARIRNMFLFHGGQVPAEGTPGKP